MFTHTKIQETFVPTFFVLHLQKIINFILSSPIQTFDHLCTLDFILTFESSTLGRQRG